MKSTFQNIKNWCNANQGFLTLLTVIITLYQILPIKDTDFRFVGTFFDRVKSFLLYKTQIPVYLILLLLLSTTFYLLRIRKRYKSQSISMRFLVGKWKNEWTINGNTSAEILTITNDFRYIINEDHVFNIEGFNYDASKREISFIKAAAKPGDNRKHLNQLSIENNELLTGTEDNYQIRYTKISD